MSAFLPNEVNRSLLPGFVAFVVAAVGAVLGFFSHYIGSHGLGIVAFVITASGIVLGFAFIVRGWWAIARGRAGIERERAEAHRRLKQPWA